MFMAVLAFGSFISFAQINSYWADKNNMNWMWWITGPLLALAAIYQLKLINDAIGKDEDHKDN